MIDGPYKNRLLWSRLNLDNPNAQAVQIAQGELSAICRAVGVMQPKDSIELHNLPLLITVKCKKREDTGDVVNEIKGYAKKEAATGAAPAGDDEHPALGAEVIELELPFPPSVNHYYRRVGPRTLISREGRRFRERGLLRSSRRSGVRPIDRAAPGRDRGLPAGPAAPRHRQLAKGVSLTRSSTAARTGTTARS